MSQVVGRPGGKQLRQGYDTESGMASATGEVCGLQVQRAKVAKIVGAQVSEFIQQLGQILPFTFARLREPIKRVKGARLAGLKNHAGARHPVGAFAVNQMTHNVECSPGFVTFVLPRPVIGQVAQECIESGGSTSEKGQGVFQIVFHHWNWMMLSMQGL
jgi:hypothetical protein